MQLSTLISTLFLLSSAVEASTFARVCQAGQVTSPSISDCKSAASDIQNTYGDNITQTGVLSSCQVIWSYGTCQVDICAYPYATINTSDVVSAINDITTNCQAAGTNSSPTYTGGYEIILNTNFTIGVLGTKRLYTPQCTTSNTNSPTLDSCQNALNNVNTTTNYTMSDPSGCTIVSQSGNCAMNYCAVQGAQINGLDLHYYLANALYACGSGSYSSGILQIDTTSSIGVFATTAAAPFFSSQATCQYVSQTFECGPSQKDCMKALKSVQGPVLTQSQVNGGCTTVAASGNCVLNLCAPFNTTASPADLSNAFQQINSTCASTKGSSVPNIAGIARLNNATLSIATTNIPQTLWCNTAPNNSPLASDCYNLIESINAATIYTQGNAADQGCTEIASNGTCKMNYCAPLGNTITGKALQLSGYSLAGGCTSGSYTSGISQLSPYTSIGIYDPPSSSSDIWGNVSCTNSGNHPDYSPIKSDCDQAIAYLRAGNQAMCANTAANSHQCTTVYTYGTCGLALCNNPGFQMDCGYFADFQQLVSGICTTDYNGQNYTSGVIGARISTGENVQLLIYNNHLQPNGPYTKRGLESLGDSKIFEPSKQVLDARMTDKNLVKRIPDFVYTRQIGNTALWIIVEVSRGYLFTNGQELNLLASAVMNNYETVPTTDAARITIEGGIPSSVLPDLSLVLSVTSGVVASGTTVSPPIRQLFNANVMSSFNTAVLLALQALYLPGIMSGSVVSSPGGQPGRSTWPSTVVATFTMSRRFWDPNAPPGHSEL